VFENAEYFEEQLAQAAEESEARRQPDPKVHRGDTAESTSSNAELSIPSNRRSQIMKKFAAAAPWKSLDEVDEHINW
jgi:hypothetical protein